MRRFFCIALQVVVWLAIVAYLVFAARHCRGEQRSEKLHKIEIDVTDYDSLQIVSPEAVRGWLADAGVALEGMGLEEVDTDRIMAVVGAQPFVRGVRAWTEQSGTLHVTLSQRRPIMRVARGGGDDFYISDDLWVLPTRMGCAEWVPIVTGEFGLPFETGWSGELREPEDGNSLRQNYTFFLKLIDFVRLTANDPFWNANIVQINVRGKAGAPEWKEPDIELIPRVGNHVIALGTTEDAQAKLAKLKLFYRNVLDHEGWDRYGLIDIRYNNQVVCRR